MSQQEQLERAWKMFDRDGSGEISKSEFAKFMRSKVVTSRVRNVPEDIVDKVFRRLDADGSGQIDFSEFMKMIREDSEGNLHLTLSLK